MGKNIKHTARYQLSVFLQTKLAKKLPLDGYDIAILVTMFDFMDSGEIEMCYASAETISEISHVHKKTILKRIVKLANLGLITRDRGRSNIICIGEVIKREVPPRV